MSTDPSQRDLVATNYGDVPAEHAARMASLPPVKPFTSFEEFIGDPRALAIREAAGRLKAEASKVRNGTLFDWQSDIAELKRGGHFEEALVLLGEMMDAAEAMYDVSVEEWDLLHEIGEEPVGSLVLNVWPHRESAIIYRKTKDYAAEVSVLERGIGHVSASGGSAGNGKHLQERVEKAKALRDKSS